MAAPDGKLGDPFASREVTVRKMLDAIGRDASDLTFSAASIGSSATLPDDPDVHIAFNALVEITADVLSSFRLFNVYRKEIDPDGSGTYQIPPQSGISAGAAWDSDLYNAAGGGNNQIAAVRVIDQPSDLNLVWRGANSSSNEPLVDTISGEQGSFAGKGTVIVEVAYWLPWELLPYVYRKYIYTAATRRFIQRAVGATDYIGFTQQDEQMALARAQQYDLESGPANFFTGSGSGERPAGTGHGILDRGPY